jgi:hypothetical protein
VALVTVNAPTLSCHSLSQLGLVIAFDGGISG